MLQCNARNTAAWGSRCGKKTSRSERGAFYKLGNAALWQLGMSAMGGKQTLRKALVVVLKPDREARPLAIGALTRAQRSAQLLCERSDDAHAQAATNRIGVEVWG